MNDDGSEFRVVDRRRFTDEGDEKSHGSTQAPPEVKKAAPAQLNNPEPPKKVGREDHEGDMPPVDFSSFVVSLGTQSMMFLGEIPDPQTRMPMPVNLDAARQTIDILAMLAEKTRGNLSQEEDKLLQDILTSLRIAFVAKAKTGR